MPESTHRLIILSAPAPGRNGMLRHPLHLCEELDDKLADLTSYLRRVQIPTISTSHLVGLAAGPEHPLFDQAVKEYGLEVLTACDPGIVSAAIDMVAATGLLPTLAVNDDALHKIIATAFTSERDWENLHHSAAAAILSWSVAVLDLPESFAEQSKEERTAISSATGALCVAMLQARAAWTPSGSDQ